MYSIKRFFDCQVPVNRCNFECDYCTVGQWKKVQGEGPTQYTPFKYSIEQMGKALSPERLGGTCAFNLCGNGETFFHPQILEFAETLLKMGHFVSIVTNGTVTPAIDYLCNLDEEIKSRIFIKFSFHYIELKKRNFLKMYFDNVKKAHKSGLSLTVELVASDQNVSYIDEIKKICLDELGVLCHLTDPRLNTDSEIKHLTEMPMEEHLKVWEQFDSALFDYRQATWGQSRRNDFCYGGVWSFNLSLSTGKLKQCYRNSDTIQYIFECVDEPIHFIPRGCHCSFAHCFNSHVFDCLCGVIPEIDSPFYAELRNRILPDGTEWIKGPYKEIYNEKVCKNNSLYSNEEKILANGVIDLHNNYEPQEVFDSLMNKRVKELMKEKEVFVFGEDFAAEYLTNKLNIPQTRQLTDEEKAMIIVTDFEHFPEIKRKMLEENITVDIVSIVDLILLR